MTFSYQIIRSDRKTMAIQIMPDGSVVVRSPKRMRVDEVRKFVNSKSTWIEKHLTSRVPRNEEKLTDSELKELRERTSILVTERVRYFAPLVGVTYNQIAIRVQRARWGSCSSKGNLNFNCLLALVPPDVLDYIVVHELCHRKELNHSERFWTEVGKVLPDYKIRKKWLKDNGANLIARL